jgi:hypothetical protein
VQPEQIRHRAGRETAEPALGRDAEAAPGGARRGDPAPFRAANRHAVAVNRPVPSFARVTPVTCAHFAARVTTFRIQ